MIIIGGFLALLGACVFAGWGWVQVRYSNETAKPTWLVLLDAGSNDTSVRSGALSELFARHARGELSGSQINAYVDRLGEALQSSDVKEETDALTSLTALGSASQRAIPALAKASARPDQNSSFVATRFGMVEPSQAAAQMLDSFGPPGQAAFEREVRAGSPQALKNWLKMGKKVGNDPQFVQLILNALSSPDEYLSYRANSELNYWFGNFPSAPVLAGLKDSHPNTRIRCLSLLTKLDKHPTLDVLQPLLHDSDPDVQFAAAIALTKSYQWTNDPRAEQWLIDILSNLQRKGRVAAADALCRYRTQGSIDALRIAMKDQDQDISTVAVCSLERIGGESALDAIMEALDGLPPDRREYAEQVADRMAHGSYKKTDYWQKHEATKRSH